ncbi:hypothetical protein [Ancrocorticia populi]|uniref:hypothetical protein n=1 Tax=Ancrocorticia populi TaxID=2175228 RepID=UPI003F91DAD6
MALTPVVLGAEQWRSPLDLYLFYRRTCERLEADGWTRAQAYLLGQTQLLLRKLQGYLFKKTSHDAAVAMRSGGTFRYRRLLAN